MTKQQHTWVWGTIIVGLVVFGGLAYFGYSTWVQQNAAKWAEIERQKAETHKQVEDFANQLDKDRNGHKYNHYEGEPPTDSWGHPLVIRYRGTGVIRTGEMVTVISAGPDGVIDTKDDIKTERRTR